MTIEPLEGFDFVRPHANIRLDGATAVDLDIADADEALDRLLDQAAVACAFEQIGGAEACLWMARDYALQRSAFGRPIASYQALKHKLADLYVLVELARSNAFFAAWAMDHDASALPAAAATARLAATEAYETAARESLQTHGGIGFTWDADCHFHYRRARLLSVALGTPVFWSERLFGALQKTRRRSA
ncbi:MAG: acyl-CoA dehydrogenase family protein [Rhizomicrobium sp.]